MLFDKACGFCEKYAQGFIPLLESAKVFDLPIEATVKKLRLTKEEISDQRDSFFLPFRTVSIEGDILSKDLRREITCVIFRDEEKNSLGFRQRREFVVFMKLVWGEGCNLVVSGVIENVVLEEGTADEGFSMGVRFSTNKGFLGLPKDGCEDDSEPVFHAIKDDALAPGDDKVLREIVHTVLCRAVGQILFVNLRTRTFIVEKSSTCVRHDGGKKILRSHERPRYVFLTPKEIRRIFGEDHQPGTHASPIPHERRRHYRVLRSEFYKEKRGKVIVVPAVWVGTKEKVVGSTRYKVMVDA